MIAARLRRRMERMQGDDGIGLVFVLLITTLLMIMLGTATTAVVAQIVPTGISVQDGAANAAAEAGIEDFIAQVNKNCPPTSGFACSWLATNLTSNSGHPTTVAGADGTGTKETFVWTVTTAVVGKARVRSSGTATVGSTTRTRVLVADVEASPSFNNFEYYTKFETFPSDFIDGFYSPRDIQITSGSDTSNSTISGSGVLSWQGTCYSTDTTDANHCTPAGGSTSTDSTNVCEDLYYPSSNGPGRGTDSAWNNTTGRRPAATPMTAMFGGNTPAAYPEEDRFGYYSEQGTFTPTTGTPSAETHYDTCDSSFEPNMVMNGPIYSQDAYLVDRAKDTGTSKNSMPIFGDYAYTMWDGTINGAMTAPGPNGGHDRPYPGTDGSLSTTLSPQPVYTSTEYNLPADATASKPLATCTYYGPTRIQIKQGIAYVTSPQTPVSPAPTGPAYCYASTSAFTNANAGPGTGVVQAAVPISSTTLIYVANPTSGSPALATSSNKVFNLADSIPMPAATGTSSLTGTWNDDATYNSADPCPSNDPTKRRNFDCEAGNYTAPATPPDLATAITNAVNATMKAGAASTTVMQTNLTNAVKALFRTAALTTPQPVSGGYYQYTVSVGTPTSSATSTAAPSLSPADPFLQGSSSGGFTTTTMNATVTVSRLTCAKLNGSGQCNAPTTSTIYSGSATGSTSAGTDASTSEGFPWFGSTNSYTDPDNDVTRNYTGYGDVYVEGQLKGNLTLVAEHDIVVTNDLTYSNTDVNTTTDGLALVAVHNVRVYRPLTCTDPGTAGVTTAGYCPNDLTGVYTQPQAWPLPNNFPSDKYTPDAAPSITNGGTGTIYATIFTLRGCFMIDNFYRGNPGSSLNIWGGLYQYHRGPTSLPYQGRPYQGSTTKMPGVVLNYNYDDMRAGQQPNGGLRVPWIPNPEGRPTGSSRTWNVVTISTGS